MDIERTRTKRLTLAGIALVGGAALLAAACGGGTSSKDKTATAGAGGSASTPAATKAPATSAATKAATTPAATAAATKAATTPAAGATTAATGAGVKVADSASGKILVGANGLSLYTFSNDVAGSGKSAAEGLTAVWPPLSLDAAPSGVVGATGEWTIFTRADGKKQVAYKGMPLYFFVNDKAPGDTKGDKVGGVWFIAVP